MFKEYLKDGIAEVIPPNEIKPFRYYEQPTYYLAHRPIIKQCASTKVRPVFDASAKTSTGFSLNDALHPGPSLFPDMVGILLRFRRWPIAVTGDIKKAFLNMFCNVTDKDVHRFLLKIEGVIIHCRFNRIPFGNTSSPFLLNATLFFHLSQFPDSPAVQELSQNLFVDNLMSGGDSQEETEELYREACRILQSGGFTLDKW